MKDRMRRLGMLLAGTALGALVLFVDIPFLLVLGCAAAAGAAILISSRDLPLKRLRLRREVIKKGGTDAPEAEAGGVALKAEEAKRRDRRSWMRLGDISPAGVKAVLSGLLRSRSRMEEKASEIDRTLDTLIGEKPATAGSPGPGLGSAAQALPGSVTAADPFLALSGAKVDQELLSAPTGERSGVRGEQEIAKLDLSTEKESGHVTLDSEPDEVEEILKAFGEETGVNGAGGEESGSPGGLGDLSELEGLDLGGELDLGDLNVELPAAASNEGTAGAVVPEATQKPSPVAPPVPPSPSQAKAAPIDPLPSDPAEIGVFGPEKGTDLISALKSDISTVKRERDLSLLRDLKDQRFETRELVSELQEVLRLLPSKSSAPDAAGRGGG